MQSSQRIGDPAEFQGLGGRVVLFVYFAVEGGEWWVKGEGVEDCHAVPAGGYWDGLEGTQEGDGGGVREVGVG
jgi:hypothetical protein